jgi:hypothetical protein
MLWSLGFIPQTVCHAVNLLELEDWACGTGRPAIINAPGSIQSPPDPSGENGYLHNAHCSWLIQAGEQSVSTSQVPFFNCFGTASSSQVVRIEFTLFDLEPSYLCAFANVTLYDGSYDTPADEIDKFCGTALPPIVHSAGSDLLVTFKSGHSGTGSGVNAQFDFIPLQGFCLLLARICVLHLLPCSYGL